MYRKRHPYIAAFLEEKEADCAPFSFKWQVWRKAGDNLWLMAKQSKDGYMFAPLYVHSFHFLRPHKLTEAEKFNIRYPDPSKIPTVADKLRYYRYKKSLLQRDVARHIGIDRGTYARYEETDDFIPIDNLIKIAELFEIDPQELILDDYSRFLFEGQGWQIRAIRKGMGMTQNEFGRLMGVHGGTVKKWEAERLQFQRATYERLSAFAG